MYDVEDFLNETIEFGYDFDEYNLYPDYSIVEFTENVLNFGCLQKMKKRIYDEWSEDDKWEQV